MSCSEPPCKRLKSSEEKVLKGGCNELKGGRETGEQGTYQESGDDSVSIGLSESDVGISEHVSSHAGFFAILKRRYCDFIVHELCQDGGVVKLANFSVPIEDNDFDGDEGELENLLGTEDASAIRDLAQSNDKDREVKITTTLNKEERTCLHQTVRGLYPNMESETQEGEGTQPHKVIVFRHVKQERSGKAKSGGWSSWPRERGSYCRFVLYKENKGTMEAISVLSRLLKIKSSCFHYAGTKDRRAITSQLVTAFKVTAERLLALNQKLRNMKLGNFEYVSNPLRLGDLTGNMFTIILRNVSCESHVIAKAVESLSEAGFVNYFGMQRFGTSSIPTHHIGRCLIHSDWKGAIDLILKPRSGESEEMVLAREYYQITGDIAGTLSRVPKSNYIERLLLQGLERHAPSNNYLAAFNSIPRNMRLMYLHSWQSFCWNHVVSWRLKTLGHVPVVGDLIMKQRSSTTSNHDGVEYVTEENVGKYDIHDVVMPMAGYDVQLPLNDAKGEYEKLLKKEGVSMEQLNHRVKDVALMGSYRHIIIKPKDISWEELYYEDYTVPLVSTDVDQQLGRKKPQSLPDGNLKAVKLEFSLPSSSYATMAVRELLKMDTSSSFQASLNTDDQ